MFFLPQLSNKALADLCHRLSVEAEAGIDFRRTWRREAEVAKGRARPCFAHVRDAVAKGESLSLALVMAGSVFPPLFVEMVRVGEQTGTLAKVLRRLESHYRRQAQAERIFLSAIAWPVIELALAIIVIGLMIWILGIIGGRTGKTPDPLGLGLVGTRGLMIYLNAVLAVGLVIVGLVVALRHGLLRTRSLQRAVMKLPYIRQALEKISLARLAWALHLAFNVEIDLRRALPLVLRATGNDHFEQYTPQIVAEVAAGHPLHVAFRRTGAFPPDFLDTLAVAEESGQVVESMDHLSKCYEQDAESAVKALAVIFGLLVGGLVMAVIVLLIFRLASFYISTLQQAVQMSS